jgi:hypothetical protein
MKSILRTVLIVIGLILCISANGQETATRGTIQETGGNIVVYLETASWGQGYPFNEQCWTSYGGTTHAKTGCVSTAYAIVMRYHKFPKEGTANKLYNCQAAHTYVELTDRIYDWDNMPLVYDGNWTEAQIYEVSKIMSHLAHANFSSFGSGATTANEERETARLNRYFNYQKIAASYQRDYTKEQWEAMIRESLDNGCPVPYAANNSGTGDTRHMFVIDGYTDNGYFHFNFGWNGGGNGWFKLDNITPYQGDNYSWKDGSEHYANFNLMPNVARQTITATVAPTNAGTVAINSNQAANEVTAELFEGSQVTLTAKANDGYIFSHWSKGAETISTESICKVTVDANGNDYVANFTEYSGPTTAEYTISPTTGTLTNGTSKSSTWTFTKTSECPAELTLQSACGTTAVNAMNINSGTLQLYAFDYDMQSGMTYTLGVPEGFLITGYELTYKMSSSYNITIENETMKQIATKSDQVFTATGLSTTSTSFSLTGTVANNFVKVTRFIVTVQKEGSPETGIETIEIPVEESIYNLKGEQLDNITEPGIYIVNGKKILKR